MGWSWLLVSTALVTAPVDIKGAGQLEEGRRDAQRRWVPTRRWEDWRQEIPWMSLYFSAGVWISLALIRTPPAAKIPPA